MSEREEDKVVETSLLSGHQVKLLPKQAHFHLVYTTTVIQADRAVQWREGSREGEADSPLWDAAQANDY